MPVPESREDWIVREARRRPLAECAAFLDGACAGDLALRQRIEAMLAGPEPGETASATGPEADRPAIKVNLADSAADAVGQMLGRYKLLEKVGEGGFGIVYVAEQKEPVKRRVALKIIKLGMDTRQVVARFEAERQALALMDHPNIAKVLDGGATESGRPYFVMELVHGIRITQYCDQNKLSTKQRLELFIPVCQAIQHAHQKGIIHRDIKPSNILVTLHDAVPVPKVIDFGIAKATQQDLTDKTVYTQLQQFVGTPAYMSPEQAEMSGLDIDTRSDIYSLGVLLYELLTGATPFDAKELTSQGIEAMRKTIREKEPPRPSTKVATLPGEELTTTAARRATEAPKLISLLRGDLDWILMKCLEKDRTRRYETAHGLAMELKRHLANEPVLAQPPSSTYRFQKLVRRNKLAFAAAGAVTTALLMGIAVSTWQAVRATQARREAVTAQQEQTRLRVAAQKAQEEETKQKAMAEQELYDSLVGQARANRLARRLGYRDGVFALLEQAKALDVPKKSLSDIRNEAVVCLGDFVGLTPTTFTNFPTNLAGTACLDPSGKLAAFALSDGTIELRAIPLGKEVARLAGTNGVFDSISFNATGDEVFAVSGPAEDQEQFLQSLPQRRVYSWGRDADGNWQETGNRALSGAYNFLNHGKDVLVFVVEAGSFESADPQSRSYLKFRLFNLTTEAFVSGYEVSNAVPAQLVLTTATDGRLLAVETRNPAVSVEVRLYDWKSGQLVNQMLIPLHGPLSLSPDGKYLCCLSAAGGAIYTVPQLERIGQFKENFQSAPAIFAGNMVVLPIWQQRRVRIWDLLRREDLALLDEPESAVPVAFSQHESSLLTLGAQQARLYRLTVPEKLELPSHSAAVTAVALPRMARAWSRWARTGWCEYVMC
jgi:serine/threonine protein kinase/WD40 repeat protein